MCINIFIPQGFGIRPTRVWFNTVAVFLSLFFSLPVRGASVSEEQAIGIRAAIDASIKKLDPAYLNSFLDARLLFQRIDLPYMPAATDALVEGVSVGLRAHSLGQAIVNEIRSGGSYTFLRMYRSGDVYHLVYRLYMASGGLNYHDWELAPARKGVRAADVLIYYSGERMSEIMSGFIDGFVGQGSLAESAAAVHNIQTLYKAGNIAEAAAAYGALPDAVRKLRLVQLINIQIASKSENPDAYPEALEQFAQNFPDAVNTPLLMIDAYLLQGQYSKARAAVDRLDSLVGGDAFLDYFRGLISKAEGETEIYHAFIRRAYIQNKDVSDVLLEMIAVSIGTNDYLTEEAAVAAYRANPNFNQELLEQVRAKSRAGE